MMTIRKNDYIIHSSVMQPALFKILVLVNLLSFGRYFSYVFIPTFQVAIKNQLGISSEQVLELLEWYEWPNMILSVICGFLMDNVVGIRPSVVIFSSIAVIGHLFFILSFYLHSFWLCAASQLLFGVGYETIFIIQVTFCGRHFIGHRVYSVVGVLFSISYASILLGKMVLPLIYASLGNSLLKTMSILLLSHMVSFVCALYLGFFSSLDNSNPHEHYVLKRHFSPSIFLLMVVLIFYYSPNLQFWSDFKHILKMKYRGESRITELFFATTGVSMLVFGFLLDRVRNRIKYLLLGLSILFLAHLLLTFTFIEPWPIIIFIGIAHALSQLVIWVFLFFILPKNEYATAMGFLQSFQNLTFAMGSNLKPQILYKFGLFVQGLINIACIIMAYGVALLLWYLN